MFYVHGCEICCVPAIFERRRGRLGSKISGYGQLAEVAVYFAMSGLPPSRHRSIGSAVSTPGWELKFLYIEDGGFALLHCISPLMALLRHEPRPGWLDRPPLSGPFGMLV